MAQKKTAKVITKRRKFQSVEIPLTNSKIELIGNSIEELKSTVHTEFNDQVLQELVEERIVEVDSKKNTVKLTEPGEKKARRIIRAHRLAERLISDVLGEEYEAAAGEFEHTINLRLVNGI